MKFSPEEKQLLDDVLADDSHFREALLHQTLRAVRVRRRVRQALNATVALVVVTAFAMFWFPTSNRELIEPIVAKKASLPFLLVRSHALPPNAIIRTVPGNASIVQSSSTHVQIVKNSSESSALRQLDEQELLQFFAGRSAAIVQLSQTEQVLLLTREDAKGFPLE